MTEQKSSVAQEERGLLIYGASSSSSSSTSSTSERVFISLSSGLFEEASRIGLAGDVAGDFMDTIVESLPVSDLSPSVEDKQVRGVDRNARGGVEPDREKQQAGSEQEAAGLESLREVMLKAGQEAQVIVDAERAKLLLDPDPSARLEELRTRASRVMIEMQARVDESAAPDDEPLPRLEVRLGSQLGKPDTADFSLTRLLEATSSLNKPSPAEVQLYLNAFAGKEPPSLKARRTFAGAATGAVRAIGCSFVATNKSGERCLAGALTVANGGLGFAYRPRERRTLVGAGAAFPSIRLSPK